MMDSNNIAAQVLSVSSPGVTFKLDGVGLLSNYQGAYLGDAVSIRCSRS